MDFYINILLILNNIMSMKSTCMSYILNNILNITCLNLSNIEFISLNRYNVDNI